LFKVGKHREDALKQASSSLDIGSIPDQTNLPPLCYQKSNGLTSA
jgi:hypothetical protein